MTNQSKKLLHVFLTRASMENNESLADALWLEPRELRLMAHQLIEELKVSRPKTIEKGE